MSRAARSPPPAATSLLAGLLTATAVASAGPPSAAAAPSAAAPAARPWSEGTVGGLEVENSFVSSVGWVKPGDTYPSRVIVTNTSALPVAGASVSSPRRPGSTILRRRAGAARPGRCTWAVGPVAAGAARTLVLESRAATLAQLPTIVWRDLSTPPS